jgi:hypothetical protein
MTATSPALNDAFRLLRAEIYRHLDEAEYLPQRYDVGDEEGFEQMSTVIPDLVAVIRGIVIAHKDDEHGACRSCGTPWPCAVVSTVHQLVKDPAKSFHALLEQAHAI